VFSLLGYAVIPYGPGLAISDYNLGILYMLAVSSLATYGILLAGWSANSKYAFLGSQWPNKDVSLYLKQTISEKFIKQILLTLLFLLTLLDTLCVTPYLWYLRGSKVKILLKMNNSQVTKALNSLVGTSEAIRLLSMFPSLRLNIKGCRSYIRVSHPENPFPSVTQARGKSKE
jgi:hypothetical protein